MNSVEVNHVFKQYSMLTSQSRELLALLKPVKNQPAFLALQDVSFQVKKGETVGLIGLNGSGKSTLSNVLAGIVPPTSGEVKIKGEVSLLAIGAGLKPTLSGVENIRMKCLMLGYSTKEINRMIPEIIEFAGLQSFIHQPIKRYSSGMKARLGFAIAIQIDPDILIIDEALSVGDTTFHKKCTDKIKEFQALGKTIFFVSHAMSQVQNLCDRIIWLHYGEVRLDGPADEVGLAYSKFVHQFNKLSEEEKKTYQADSKQHQMQAKMARSVAADQKANSLTWLYQGGLAVWIIFSAACMEVSEFSAKIYDFIGHFLKF
ncbi:ABC transporter ATP-binding protein [Listeria costaricensis]|uniref:ABC transporter ATP-binding protein n=1 Tax=Listeria costaricensis TaxID=2026604 RepID=UPI000C06ACEC|nr:ABC transporter ATP-binding protein [Listeria costaricensis]